MRRARGLRVSTGVSSCFVLFVAFVVRQFQNRSLSVTGFDCESEDFKKETRSRSCLIVNRDE